MRGFRSYLFAVLTFAFATAVFAERTLYVSARQTDRLSTSPAMPRFKATCSEEMFLKLESLPSSPPKILSAAGASKSRYSPIVIKKRIDKSTPLIAKALTKNEVLPSLVLTFYRPTSAGKETLYYKIELKDAMVVEQRKGSADFEYVKVTFERYKPH